MQKPQSQSIETNLSKSQSQNGNYQQVTPGVTPIQAPGPEEEALLLVIKTSVHELNQPLTVVLGLSELLLSQADPNSPQAEDLRIIVEEMQRMNEVIRGLKLLAQYQTPIIPS